MLSKYIREGYLYSENDLLLLFNINGTNFGERKTFYKYLESLKRRKLLRTRRRRGSKENYYDDSSILLEDDLFFDDYVGVESNEIQYIFRFVGLIYFDDIVLFVYPKYIQSSIEPKEQMRQVLKVLLKHEGKKYFVGVPELIISEGVKNNDINIFSVIIYLINDYLVNGLYAEDDYVLEENGDGRIMWQPTVDQFYPIIKNNKPYYLDFVTRKKTNNDNNFCVRLHKYILTKATNELQMLGLSDIFDFPVLELSDDNGDFFGDPDEIKNAIESEISVQFDDRKLSILKALYLYVDINQQNNQLNQDGEEFALEFFGTRSFYTVWEDVIASVYGSQKQMTFDEIISKCGTKLSYSMKYPNNSNENISPKTKLGKIIEKPIWVLKDFSDESNFGSYLPQDTFIPDFLQFSVNCKEFYILDAKYYVLNWFVNDKGEYSILHQPGVEDIAKQYLYYLAYEPILSLNGIDVNNVKNYFVMPTEEDDIDVGYAKLDMFSRMIPNVFKIRVKMINTKKLFKNYLEDHKLDASMI